MDKKMVRLLLFVSLVCCLFQTEAMEQDEITEHSQKKKIAPNRLAEASARGDKKVVEELLDSGVDVNSLDDKGKTALYYAVMQDDADLVEFLIEKGATALCDIPRCSSLLNLAALRDKPRAFDILFLYFFKTEDEIEDEIKENQIKETAVNNMQSKSPSFHRPSEARAADDARAMAIGNDLANALKRKVTPNPEAEAVEKEFEEARALMWGTKGAAECIKAKEVFERLAEQEIFSDIAFLGSIELAQLYYYGWMGVKDEEKARFYAAKYKNRVIKREDPVFLQEAQGIAAIITDELLPAASQNDLERYLYTAARHGSSEIAFLLLHHGVAVDCIDSTGKTSLHLAASEGHYRMVELLLEKGASVDARDNEGKTALHYAVEGPSLAELSWKIVHEEPYTDKQKIVELLLQRNAKRLACDKKGCTPLHQAAGSSDRALVEMVIEPGMDIDMLDNSGETALYKAVGGWAIKKDLSVFELLVQKGAKMTRARKDPFFSAIWFRQKHIVAYMLDQGITINAPSIEGKGTPLYYAARSGSEDIVELFLAKGAKASVRPSPLEEALSRNSKRMIAALINQLTIEGEVPSYDMLLKQAVSAGSDEIVELCLERGADVHVIMQSPIVPYTMLDHNSNVQKAYRRIMRLLRDFRSSKKTT